MSKAKHIDPDFIEFIAKNKIKPVIKQAKNPAKQDSSPEND
jgi:hypothetical protein